MEASNKRQTSLKIKRLVYIPKKGANLSTDSFHLRRRLPTLPLLRSTIGVTRLNFSVRNGEEVDPSCYSHLNFIIKILTGHQSEETSFALSP